MQYHIVAIENFSPSCIDNLVGLAESYRNICDSGAICYIIEHLTSPKSL